MAFRRNHFVQLAPGESEIVPLSSADPCGVNINASSGGTGRVLFSVSDPENWIPSPLGDVTATQKQDSVSLVSALKLECPDASAAPVKFEVVQ